MDPSPIAQNLNTVSDGFMAAVMSGVSGIIAAIGGVLWGKRGVEKKLEQRESEIRATVANELRTKILNDPLNVSPSFAEQNRKEHAELYDMVRKHEAKIAGLVEHDISLDKTLDRMATQLDKLYDKIIGGKKK